VTSADAQFGTEARRFFGRQQAARRERQRQARRTAAAGEFESHDEPEGAQRSIGAPGVATAPESAEARTGESAETSSGEPLTLQHEASVADPDSTLVSPSREEAAPEASPYVLRVLAGEEASQPFAVAYGATTIGRLSGSDILLHDRLVSHHHASIETTPDRITIRDKNSTNGTLVNGVEISETTELHHGDTVLIGDVLLRLEWAGEES
jgi:hypothetical protein